MKILGLETQEGKSVNVVSLQPVGSAFALRLKDSDFFRFSDDRRQIQISNFPFYTHYSHVRINPILSIHDFSSSPIEFFDLIKMRYHV